MLSPYCRKVFLQEVWVVSSYFYAYLCIPEHHVHFPLMFDVHGHRCWCRVYFLLYWQLHFNWSCYWYRAVGGAPLSFIPVIEPILGVSLFSRLSYTVYNACFASTLSTFLRPSTFYSSFCVTHLRDGLCCSYVDSGNNYVYVGCTSFLKFCG